MEHPSNSILLSEPRRSRRKPWLVALGLFIGALFIPLDCGQGRMQPFDPDGDSYRVENRDGNVSDVDILYFKSDTLITSGENLRLPLGGIARISRGGTTYYLCGPCKYREGETMAKPEQKWPPGRGEKWNVGGVLVLLFAAAMGWLH